MTELTAALWTEILKVRRSKAPWLTMLGFSMAPLMSGLFMLILRDPDWARNAGLITAKAQLTAGTADWPAYFGLLAQAIPAAGFVLFGLVVAWVFGREHSDRTAKDLLALPVSREAIVAAKFIVVACWCAALALIAYLLALAVGSAIGLPGWSSELLANATRQLALLVALSVVVATPFAWAASAGHGYLPPVGLMFLALFLSQVLAVMGWGEFFPWAVPAIVSGAAGPDAQQVGAGSYLLVALTGLLGVAGTLAWWRWADQTA